MSVIVNCPHCRKPTTVDNSQYRDNLECPWCKRNFRLTFSVIVNCPHCGKPTTVNNSQYRGNLECPWCKRNFRLTFSVPEDAGPSHFLIDCPKCHAKVKFAKTLLGRLGRCPSCQELVKLDPHTAKTESAAREPKRNEPTKESTNWFWPSVKSLESAHRATLRAFWFALVIAFVTAILSILASCGVQPVLDAGVEPWAVIDAGLFAAIAIGLYCHSRVAAVGGLVLYVLAKVVMLSEGGITPGNKLAIPLVLAFLFLGGVRGAFSYQRLKRAATQEPTSQESPVSLDLVAVDKKRDRGNDEKASSGSLPGKAETMNNLQKMILAVGGVLLLANLVFPPLECLSGYGAIGGPRPSRQGRGFVFYPSDSQSYVDWSLSGATSLAIVAGTGLLFGLTVLFKKPRAN